MVRSVSVAGGRGAVCVCACVRGRAGVPIGASVCERGVACARACVRGGASKKNESGRTWIWRVPNMNLWKHARTSELNLFAD